MEDMWEAGRDASGAMEAGVQARAGKRIDLVHGTARGINIRSNVRTAAVPIKKKSAVVIRTIKAGGPSWTKAQSRGMADHTQRVSS
jgi:hypothetical protein